MITLNTMDVALFLKEHYPKFKDVEVEYAVNLCDTLQDRTVIASDEETGDIIGLAVYVRLSDETYERLDDLDLNNQAILESLYCEDGKNIHFIIIAGNAGGEGFIAIKNGMRHVVKTEDAKTLSWFHKETNRLIKHVVTEEYKNQIRGE